jgi:hypothetical protein
MDRPDDEKASKALLLKLFNGKTPSTRKYRPSAWPSRSTTAARKKGTVAIGLIME